MRQIIFVLAICCFCVGCSLLQSKAKENKEYTTKSKLKYVITQSGFGKKPKIGDRIKINFTGKLTNGKQFESTYNKGFPFVFQVGVGQVIDGLDEALLLFRVGTNAKITVPSSLGYGNKKMGKIPPNSNLIFDIKLEEIIQPPIPFDVRDKDTLFLDKGLQLIKVKQTQGKKAQSFREVTVNYSGYLENGSLFDSSINRGIPFTFKLGVGQVIEGWEKGIARMNVGEKVRLIVPPKLGYGKKGMLPAIPANATLIFDIELLSED